MSISEKRYYQETVKNIKVRHLYMHDNKSQEFEKHFMECGKRKLYLYFKVNTPYFGI